MNYKVTLFRKYIWYDELYDEVEVQTSNDDNDDLTKLWLEPFIFSWKNYVFISGNLSVYVY